MNIYKGYLTSFFFIEITEIEIDRFFTHSSPTRPLSVSRSSL